MERERYTCPVTLLKDMGRINSDEKNEEIGPLVTLKATHKLPFAIGDTEVRSVSCSIWSDS